jgi:hypothetical protein
VDLVAARGGELVLEIEDVLGRRHADLEPRKPVGVPRSSAIQGFLILVC